MASAIIKLLIIMGIIILVSPICYARSYEEPTNITGFADLFQWTNRVTDYKFGISIVIAVFFISFIALKGFESGQALTGSLFMTAVVAIGLFALQMLDITWTIAVILLCALVAILLMWSGT